MDSNVNNGIGSREDHTQPSYSEYTRSFLAAQGISDHAGASGSSGGPSDAGAMLGCLMLFAFVFMIWLVFYLPASGLAYVCQMVGLHPYWGLRFLVVSAIGGFSYYLYREWTSLRQLKEALELPTVTEWRARKPGGFHLIPFWYSILGMSLLTLFVMMWANPIHNVIDALSWVLFVATANGLIFGSMTGLVVSWVDQARLAKILKEKGPLLSPRTAGGESIPDANFL